MMSKQTIFSVNGAVVLAVLAMLLVTFMPSRTLAGEDDNNEVFVSLYSNGECRGHPDTTTRMSMRTNECETGDSISLFIRGKLVTDVTSAAIYCPHNKFSYGTGADHKICSTRRRPLTHLCVPQPDGRHSFKIKCVPPNVCKSNSQISRGACARRMSVCRDRPLKWAGNGCKSSSGHPLRDGGCQCKGYCGYQCEGACSSDSECFWSEQKGRCYQKGSNLAGGTISTCPNAPFPPLPSPQQQRLRANNAEPTPVVEIGEFHFFESGNATAIDADDDDTDEFDEDEDDDDDDDE